MKVKPIHDENTRSIGKSLILAAMFVILIVLIISSFVLGRYDMNISQVIGILADAALQKVTGGIWCVRGDWTKTMQIVVMNIRLPRILMACMVGACLSAAGAAYQGVFQNPMASPDVLGASSGAAFGAALGILFDWSARMVTISAFVLSLVTVGLVFLVGTRAPGMRVVNLILAGIMMSSLLSAGTSYLKLVADPTNKLPAITYWLMGSLSGTKKTDVLLALGPMAVGCLILLLIRWHINLLTLGDEEAHTMGVHTGRMRLLVIFASTLITAASIAAAGMIGWVGLVIPHLCRKIVGGNYRHLMPASMLTGAIFLLLVDNVSRNLLAVEIPIGILTAFIGAPFFIYLLMRQEHA